jgi:tripartite-type tricarboxylate transporter receptor subunit TctC
MTLRYVIGMGLFLCLLSTPNLAFGQKQFYEGKTLRIVVGFSPGGGFDVYSRIIARHLGKHIPGKPTLIVENMTGAGSLIAANYTYEQAKPDGLTIGHFIGGLIMGQLFGRPGVQFDARKFEWLGVPAKVDTVCVFSKASGITTFEKWLSSSAPVKLGATGPGSETYDVPKILQAALGLPMQIVSGYKGATDVRLAVDSGEIAGTCGGWEAMKGGWTAISSASVSVLVQARATPHPDLPKVPLAISFAKNEQARELIQVGVHDQSVILRSYALPPGTPRDRVQVLRQAFNATMQDQEFLAEINKAKLTIDSLSGEELEKIVTRLFKLDASTLERLKGILAAN